MQPLVDAQYRPLTAGQVTGILTCRSVQVRSGLELLDNTDTFVSDISDALQSGSVSHDNTATIHGTASLNISQLLTWGVQRVRPYMTLTDLDSGLSARWNLGVYVMTTPSRPVGERPATYQVTGSDKLYLLNDPIGDSYTVAKGANVLGAVTDAIVAGANVPAAQIELDGSAAAATLPAARSWPLSQGSVFNWLTVVNSLLAAVNYQPLWCDWDGVYRSGPLVDASLRGPEFAFSADDPQTSIVGQSRTSKNDMWSAPNWWRFIANNWPTTPVEGDGQYTVQNVSDGPASQQAVGRTIRKVVYLSPADQASLVSQGDAQVAADEQRVTSFTVNLSPMPAQWHLDVASFTDSAGGGTMKVATRTWKLDLFGADGQTVWNVVG